MNLKNWIANVRLHRSQIVRGACLSLVVFVTVLAVVNFLLNGILYSHFFPLFGLSLTALALGIATVKFGFSKVQKKRLLISISIVLSIGVIAVAPLFFTRGIQDALNYANFYFVRDTYLQQVNMVKRADEPRFITFRWDSFNKELLIFDESNELDNDDGIKTREWWRRAKEKEHELAVCHWVSIKVAEHFYRVTFACEAPYSGASIPPL
jgi:hypothetical protein